LKKTLVYLRWYVAKFDRSWRQGENARNRLDAKCPISRRHAIAGSTRRFSWIANNELAEKDQVSASLITATWPDKLANALIWNSAAQGGRRQEGGLWFAFCLPR
jgi:hypothetical protein